MEGLRAERQRQPGQDRERSGAEDGAEDQERHITRDVILYPTRLVMDTDTIVAAMRSPTGASAALLRMARSGRVTLPATAPLCLE